MQKLSTKLTLKTMLMIPMLLIILILVAVFIVAIGLSNIHFRIRESEVAAIQRAAASRGERLQRVFNNASGTAVNMALDIQNSVGQSLPGRVGVAGQLQASTEAASTALNASLPHLVNALRLNDGTGAFVILDASAVESGNGLSGSQTAALYFNDADTTAVNANNADLMLYCGPKQVARDMGIPLDNYWSVELLTERMGNQLNFYRQAFEKASADKNLAIEQLGFWSEPFTRTDGRQVLLYTVPLRDADNHPYGIAGIELSVDYIKTMLNPSELGYPDNGFFALSVFEGEEVCSDWIAAGGAYAIRYSGGEILQTARTEYGENVWELLLGGQRTATVATFPLNIYYSGSVMDADRWGLVAGVDNEALFDDAETLNRFFTIAVLIAVVAGVFFSIASANLFVGPVEGLARELLAADPDEEIRLTKTQIKEIDLLIGSIESLNADLLESGRRTTLAIGMTDMPIGFLEINHTRGRVYLSDFLFNMFGIEKNRGSSYIPLSRWEELYARLERSRESTMENVFLLDFVESQPFRWLRVRMAEDDTKTFGIVVDATEEILEKRRLEYERDTDLLTGLMNRGAFFAQAQIRVHAAPDKVGVMLFADLDNLKYVNDTYGHDFGDRYIRAAAGAFRLFSQADGVVSRISGDEFAIFLHGGESKQALAAIISDTYANMETASIDLPDGTQMRIRCSIGFAWYPDDSRDLELLLRYADFAMYETKRSIKGSMREFKIDSYLENSYLIEKNEEFNQFIERNLVSYAFQPIVEIFSGSVFAYEALMRPETPSFRNPGKVLQIAKNQAKLYQIERMTLFNVYAWMDRHADQLDSCRIFLNSIPSQRLSDKDLAELESRFSHVMGQSVLEVTEDEHSDWDFLSEKLGLFRRMGVKIAVDDFGSGYANEVSLININPNFVKLDRSLIQNIDQDPNKRTLVENMIQYAHPLGIKVIAEGVERLEEAETVIRLGADYLQGYYVARPAPQIQEPPPEISETIRSLASRYRDRRSVH